MSYKTLLTNLEALEGGLEIMPSEASDAAHFVREELAHTIAHARELLEALANDERQP